MPLKKTLLHTQIIPCVSCCAHCAVFEMCNYAPQYVILPSSTAELKSVLLTVNQCVL